MEQPVLTPQENGLAYFLSMFFIFLSHLSADFIERQISLGIGITLSVMLIIINFPAFAKRVKEMFGKRTKEQKEEGKKE